MAKFKVLKYSQKFLTRLGIYSYRLTEPTNEFLKSIYSYFAFFALFVTLLTSAAYFITYPTNVKPALGAFKIFFAIIQCLGAFFGIGIKMTKVKELHIELQRFADEGILK